MKQVDSVSVDGIPVEMTTGMAEQIEALQQAFGPIAVLTPVNCASCRAVLPPEPRDVFGMGILGSQPVLFFLCADCLARKEHDPHAVEDRVYNLIDAAANQLAMMNRTAEA